MTVQAFRIVQKSLSATAFDGEGARKHGGRWNSRGKPLVYTSGTLALATLEIFVHLESYEVLNKRYCYIPVDIPKTICKTLDRSLLPAGWDSDPPIFVTRELGDRWLAAGDSAVLVVPSAIVPAGVNYLINPQHPDFSKIVIHPMLDYVFSSRLLK